MFTVCLCSCLCLLYTGAVWWKSRAGNRRRRCGQVNTSCLVVFLYNSIWFMLLFKFYIVLGYIIIFNFFISIPRPSPPGIERLFSVFWTRHTNPCRQIFLFLQLINQHGQTYRYPSFKVSFPSISSIPDLDPQTLSSEFRDLCRQLELTLQHGAKDRDTSLGLAVIRYLTFPMFIRVTWSSPFWPETD